MKLSTALTVLALSSSASSVVGRKMAKGSKASKAPAEPEMVYLVVPAEDGKCGKGVKCIAEDDDDGNSEIDLQNCDNRDEMKWTIHTKGSNFKIRSARRDDDCIAIQDCTTQWNPSSPSGDLVLRPCDDDRVWWYESQGVFYSSYCAFSKFANNIKGGPSSKKGRGAYYMRADGDDMELANGPLDKKSSILVVSDLDAYRPFDLDKDSIKCGP